MKKLTSIALGIFMVPVVAVSAVSALAAGQVEGGDIYRVKNVTKGIDFTDPVTATCGDTVQFKVRIHNPGPDALTGVKVSATLPTAAATSHSSKVTVSADNANPASTSDTAGVNLDKSGTLQYVAGSTELLDAHNSKLSTLPDGVVNGSVNIPGGVGVSTEQKRFVQFSAKVNCPTIPPVEPPVVPPAPEKIKVCELSTKNIITIDEKDFDAKKHTKDLNKCNEAPAGNIKVCVIESKEIVTIKENEFDAKKHTKNLNDCAKVVTPVTPTAELPAELPVTGGVSAVLALLAASLVTGGVYAVRAITANKLG